MCVSSGIKCFGYFLGFLILEISLYHGLNAETESSCVKLNMAWTMGKKLPVSPLKILDKMGPHGCSRECQHVPVCLSVNYNRKQLTCELIGQRNSDAQPLINDKDSIYMDPPDSVSKHRNALLRHPCMYMGVKQLCK
jgi:hypothetical protein